MLYFEDEHKLLNSRLEELAIESIEKSLDGLGCEFECDISLTLVTNEEIQEINREHRKIDKATDVLSFPMIDWESPCDYKYMEENYEMFMNPENQNILLGDIVLSMDKVLSQALEYGHSQEREFSFLIVHSMLHLFGYDHMNDEDEKLMLSKQKEIMTIIDYK